MWTCPVCDEQNKTSVCSKCGFDSSCDCERYPTLALFPSAPKAISQLRKQRETQQKDLFRCTVCGGTSFQLSFPKAMYLCDRCGLQIPWEYVQKQKAQYDQQSSIAMGPRGPVAAIAAGDDHTLILLKDGTVRTAGSNKQEQGNVGQWKDVVSIAAGYHCSAGVLKDGTVLLTGDTIWTGEPVKQWHQIQSVSIGSGHIVGLRKNGTVVAAGQSRPGQCNTGSWTDVVQICAGWNFTIAVRKDGTLYTAGKRLLNEKYTNVASVAAGLSHAVILLRNGKVEACGSNSFGQCNTAEWTDISAVSAGYQHTIALRKDGTVIAAGTNREGQCDVSTWKNVIAISAGAFHTVGLCADGTILTTGYNRFGQCDAAKLLPK